MEIDKEKKPSFEEALALLEKSAQALKKNDTTLEDAMRNYEEGIGLYKYCSEILDQAKQQIEIYEKESETVKDF